MIPEFLRTWSPQNGYRQWAIGYWTIQLTKPCIFGIFYNDLDADHGERSLLSSLDVYKDNHPLAWIDGGES